MNSKKGNSHLTLLLGVVAVLFIVFMPACKKNKTLEISGHIYRACDCMPGCPVANKTVNVYSGAAETPMSNFNTDASGKFSFEVQREEVDEYLILDYTINQSTWINRVKFQLPAKGLNDLELIETPTFIIPLYHTGEECYSDSVVLIPRYGFSQLNEFYLKGPFKKGHIINLAATNNNVFQGSNVQYPTNVNFGLYLYKNNSEIGGREFLLHVGNQCDINPALMIDLCNL